MEDQVLKKRQCSEIVWAEREVPSVRMKGILASLLEVNRNCRQCFSPIHEPANELPILDWMPRSCACSTRFPQIYWGLQSRANVITDS